MDMEFKISVMYDIAKVLFAFVTKVFVGMSHITILKQIGKQYEFHRRKINLNLVLMDMVLICFKGNNQFFCSMYFYLTCTAFQGE